MRTLEAEQFDERLFGRRVLVLSFDIVRAARFVQQHGDGDLQLAPLETGIVHSGHGDNQIAVKIAVASLA